MSRNFAVDGKVTSQVFGGSRESLLTIGKRLMLDVPDGTKIVQCGAKMRQCSAKIRQCGGAKVGQYAPE